METAEGQWQEMEKEPVKSELQDKMQVLLGAQQQSTSNIDCMWLNLSLHFKHVFYDEHK